MKTWYKWLSVILCAALIWQGCGLWQGVAIAQTGSTMSIDSPYVEYPTYQEDEDLEPNLGTVIIDGAEVQHIAKIEEESNENITVYENSDGSRTMYLTAAQSDTAPQESTHIERIDEREKGKENARNREYQSQNKKMGIEFPASLAGEGEVYVHNNTYELWMKPVNKQNTKPFSEIEIKKARNGDEILGRKYKDEDTRTDKAPKLDTDKQETESPSPTPSPAPSVSTAPTTTPSVAPTITPTITPITTPTATPSVMPTITPGDTPTTAPSESPSITPSVAPVSSEGSLGNGEVNLETPPVETPPAETPPEETPLEETPPMETPPVETSPVETPPAETPPAETPPVETPPAETPPVETPPAETPPPETPPAQTSVDTPMPSAEPDVFSVVSDDENAITYTTGLGIDVMVQYRPQLRGLKEEIILNEWNNQNSFCFEIRLNGMTPVWDESSGDIILYDSQDNKEIARIPHGVAVDSADDPISCFSVDYTLEQIKGSSDTWCITITVDEEYLTDSERVYPVRIDPSIIYGDNTAVLSDTFIAEGQPDTNYDTADHLWVGSHPTYQNSQALIRFDDLDIAVPYVVQEAQLKLYATENTGSTTHHVHQIVQDWDSSTATWNNCAVGFAGDTFTESLVGGTGWKSFDVTDLVQEWYFCQELNYGLLISADNNATGAYTKYDSSEGENKPQLVVTYMPLTQTANGLATVSRCIPGDPDNGKIYIECVWQPVVDVERYEVSLYTCGLEYPSCVTSASGNLHTTTWSSLGEGLYQGGNLPCDADEWYDYWSDSAGYPESDEHRYRVRLDTFVDGAWFTDTQWVDFLDTEPPSTVNDLFVSIENPESNMPVDATASLSWSAVADVPTDMASGIDRYEIERRIYDPNDSAGWMDRRQTLPDAPQSLTYENLLDGVSQQFRIRAVDNNGNMGDWAYSTAYPTEDRTPPSGEDAEVSIDVTGWSNETQPAISWDGFTDSNGIANIGWRVKNGNTPVSWVWNPDSEGGGAWVNSASTQEGWMYIPTEYVGSTGEYTLPSCMAELDDGEWYVELRFEDSLGNYLELLNTNGIRYQKDTTAPVAAFNEPCDQYVLKGSEEIYITADDLRLSDWELTLCQSDGTAIQTLADGESGVIDYAACILETILLEDDEGYLLTLQATDVAGNVTNNQITVSIDQDMQTQVPEITLDTPAAGSILEDESDLTVEVTWQSPSGTSGEQLYINGEAYPDPSEIDLSDFPDGNVLSLHMEGQDDDAYPIYSQEVVTRDAYHQSFANEEGIHGLIHAELDADGTGDYARLESNGSGGYAIGGFVQLEDWQTHGYATSFTVTVNEEKPAGTDIVYKYSFDGGQTWEIVTPGVAVPAWQKSIMIQALLSGDGTVTPIIRDITLTADIIQDEHQVTVALIEAPQNITIEQVNYQNILHWDGQTGQAYNVYRLLVSESSTMAQIGQIPLADYTLLASGVQDDWYVDINLHHAQRFAYRVTALQTISGQQSPRESIASEPSVITCHQSHLGLESDWGTASFPVGAESGYINLLNGNLSYGTTDLVQTGRLFALVMRRTYNHQAEADSALGPQWDFSFNTRLLKDVRYDSGGNEIENGMILKDGDGSVHYFALEADGSYTAPPGTFMELTEETDGSWTLRRKDWVSYHYDENMRLTGFSEPNGNEITLDYDGDQLIEASDEVGHTLAFTYYANGLLFRVQDNAGDASQQRRVVYHYQDGMLCDAALYVGEASLTPEYEEVYTYESYGDGSMRLVGIQPPRGEECAVGFAYDVNNKVHWINMPGGDLLEIEYVDIRGNGTEGIVRTAVSAFHPAGSSGYSTPTVTVYDLNEWGGIVRTQDALGQETMYEYNGDHMLTGAAWTADVYDPVSETSAPQICSVQYTYDELGNVLTATDPLGHVTTYGVYNEWNKPSSMTVPLSDGVTATTTYTYDAYGNVETSTDPLSGITTNAYDANGLLTQVTDRYGYDTTYQYDAMGRLTQTAQEASDTQSLTAQVTAYDVYGYPTQTVDAGGRVTNMTYDLWGRVLTSRRMNDQYDTNDPSKGPQYIEERNTYDVDGHLISTTTVSSADPDADPDLRKTTYTYGEKGRLVEAAYPDGSKSVVKYIYNAAGELTVTKIQNNGYEPNGAAYEQTEWESTTYDITGRVLSETSGGRTLTYAYDASGKVISSTDEDGRIARYYFDAAGRSVKQVADPAGVAITNEWAYDDAGRLTRETDGLGCYVDYTYDALGRMLTVTQHEGVIATGAATDDMVTSYQYDIRPADGGVQTVRTDPKGNAFCTTVDGLGRTISSDETGAQVDSVYDAAGSLHTVTYLDGTQIEHLYNFIDQPTLITYDTKRRTVYAYDDYGRLASAREYSDFTTDTSIENQYTYDEMDRMIEDIQLIDSDNPDGVTVACSYDYTGQVTSIEYPGYNGATRTIGYAYDGYGRLEVVALDGDTVANYSYTNGLLDTVTTHLNFDDTGDLLNTREYIYNTAGLVNVINYRDAADDIKESHAYTYDARGYISEYDTVNEYCGTSTLYRTYEYNDRGMLTREDERETQNGDPETLIYDYDDAGNMYHKTVRSTTSTYKYNERNQLITVWSNSTRVQEHRYDDRGYNIFTRHWYANGNIKGGFHKWYNPKGEMVKSDVFNKNNSYKYDHAGKRVKKYEAGYGSFKYIYFGDTVLYREDNHGKKVEEHIIDPSGTILVSKCDVDPYKGYFFYHQDLLGSTTTIINNTGMRIQRYEYDPYGKLQDRWPGWLHFKNEVLYTGHVRDVNTDFDYMNARYYNPAVARFLTPDSYTGNPYNPNTQNVYSYTGGNPVNYVDPTGHYGETLAMSIGAAPLLALPGAGQIAYAALVAGAAACEYGPAVVNWVGMYGPVAWDWVSQASRDVKDWFKRQFGGGNSGNPDPGKGVRNKIVNSADDVNFNQSSIDKAFGKHAQDFRSYKDGSKESVNQFVNDVKGLINNGVQKSGTWHGQQGTHIFNPSTQQWAFINADGTFNTAFRLSQEQFNYLIETGVVK